MGLFGNNTSWLSPFGASGQVLSPFGASGQVLGSFGAGGQVPRNWQDRLLGMLGQPQGARELPPNTGGSPLGPGGVLPMGQVPPSDYFGSLSGFRFPDAPGNLRWRKPFDTWHYQDPERGAWIDPTASGGPMSSLPGHGQTPEQYERTMSLLHPASAPTPAPPLVRAAPTTPTRVDPPTPLRRELLRRRMTRDNRRK